MADSCVPLPHSAEFEKEIGGLIISGFKGKTLSRELKLALKSGLGGVILFKENVGAPKEILNLTKSLRDAADDQSLIVSIDHEGGRVMRVGAPFTHFPPMAALGKIADANLAREIGAAVGRELSAVGVNLVFSPVVDLAESDPKVVIGDRSFGTDPALVSKLAAAYVAGVQSQGVAACAKHFPGHGAVTGDSHLELPKCDLTRDEMKKHIEPFRAMSEAGVATTMTAHILCRALDPYYPATLSGKILNDILRDQLGFEGVIITDDVQMAGIADHVGSLDAAFMALRAGADMILVAHDIELAVAARKHIDVAARHMAIGFDALMESMRRVKALKEKYSAANKPRPPLDVIGCEEHRKIAEKLSSLSG